MYGLAVWIGGCGPSLAARPVRFESSDPADRIRAIRQFADEPAGTSRSTATVALVDRLDDEDAAVRFYALAALARLTGRRFGYRPFDPPEIRRIAVDRWRVYLGDRTAQMSAEGK
ncbi:MAG: hypothetical protein GY778_09470 [bacterium]|nr:hypothetical protein [bacterium]